MPYHAPPSRAMSLLLLPAAAALLLLAPSAALAHPGHGGHDFSDGWRHPLLGLDHLLAMVAVGLLAARFGGRGVYLLPGLFLLCMAVGGASALAGLPLLGVEYGILASLVVLGGALAAVRKLPLAAALGLTALFAAFHGHAHGAEMASGASPLPYAAGFLLATAGLHLAGVLGGLACLRWRQEVVVRLSGGAITAAGLLMFLGLL